MTQVGSWTFPVTDLRTGALIHDDAPILVDYFDDSLGVASRSLTATIPQGVWADVDVADLSGLWRRVIWPCKDGRPHGAYVIAAQGPFGPRSTGIDIVAQRVDAVFTRRLVFSTLVFRQVDQCDIARALIDYALGRTPTGVDPVFAALITPLPAAAQIPWLTAAAGLSGVLRDRLDNSDGYQGGAGRSIADALNNLTQLEAGLDYRLDYRRDEAGTFGVTITLGYPALGRTEPVIGLEWPGNITDWTQAADSGDTVTMYRVSGSGQGQDVLVGQVATDTAAHADQWPALMGSNTSSATDVNTLTIAARQQLAARTGVNEGWTVELDGAQLGTYDLGDYAWRAVAHPRWGVKRDVVRITGHRVYPARPGRSERVVPTLVEVV